MNCGEQMFSQQFVCICAQADLYLRHTMTNGCSTNRPQREALCAVHPKREKVENIINTDSSFAGESGWGKSQNGKRERWEDRIRYSTNRWTNPITHCCCVKTNNGKGKNGKKTLPWTIRTHIICNAQRWLCDAQGKSTELRRICFLRFPILRSVRRVYDEIRYAVAFSIVVVGLGMPVPISITETQPAEEEGEIIHLCCGSSVSTCLIFFEFNKHNIDCDHTIRFEKYDLCFIFRIIEGHRPMQDTI